LRHCMEEHCGPPFRDGDCQRFVQPPGMRSARAE
jgi:hypothetical protein